MPQVGYGKKLRKAVKEAERKAKKTYKCPSCSRVAVKRIANGVWQCNKCSTKYASGAFEFNL
jgi:ribosomal protein L37AE/L43A